MKSGALEESAMMKVLFSDFFNVSPELLSEHGAYNISLVTDLPLFIDPFLLFGSEKPEYKQLHEMIVAYLKFLRDRSGEELRRGLVKSWYQFPEVKQTWLGFSSGGNGGLGLGLKFANQLNSNLSTVLSNFGSEKITLSSHLEKLCLVEKGVGKDTISDFTTNLIKGYLAEYTQSFAKKHIDPLLVSRFAVDHSHFDFRLNRWMPGFYYLPRFNGDYVLLTPKDILTRQDTWINRSDLVDSYASLPASIGDEAIRAQINEFFQRILSEVDNPGKADMREAASRTISSFPQLIDAYIRQKEDRPMDALQTSHDRVHLSEEIILHQLRRIPDLLKQNSDFYDLKGITYDESLARANYLKHVIEDCDGYRMFYLEGRPVMNEDFLQVLFKLTWFSTILDVNREVNNGRGPVDYAVSLGKISKTLIEFKLARSTSLKANLEKQVEVYQKANPDSLKIKVIIFFSLEEEQKLRITVNELGFSGAEHIVMIDARNDNKPSASKVR